MTHVLRAIFTTALVLAGGAAEAASSFTLENVVIDTGGTIYRAPTLEVTDSALTREELTVLLAGADSKLPAQRMTRLSAVRITTPELVSNASANGAAQKVTYKDVVLEDVVAGRIGHARAAAAAIAISGAQTGEISGHTGAITLDGVDLSALAHILVEGRTDPAETSRTTIAAGRIADIDVDLPGGGAGHIGAVSLRDAGGRALAVPMSSLVDLAPKPDTSPPSPERRRALSGLFADLISSQTLGALELTDIVVRNAPPGSATARAGRFALDGVAGGKIARAALDGLAIANGADTSTLAHLAIAGVDLGPMLSAAVADATPRRVPFRFDRVELDGFQGRLASSPGQPVALTVAHAQLEARDWRGSSPLALAIAADHLAFDLPADDPRARPLRDLGYGRVDLTLGLEAAYDPAKLELSLGKFAAAAPDLGAVDLSLKITNVSQEALNGDTDAARAAFAASLFRHAAATVTDGGLLAHMIDAQARASKASAADIRARWATGLRAAIMAMLADNADRGAVADAAERFVRTGGKLSLDADAPSGLGLIDAMLAGGVQGLLGKMKLTAGN